MNNNNSNTGKQENKRDRLAEILQNYHRINDYTLDQAINSIEALYASQLNGSGEWEEKKWTDTDMCECYEAGEQGLCNPVPSSIPEGEEVDWQKRYIELAFEHEHLQRHLKSHPSIQWVKASERLPNMPGQYHVKRDGYRHGSWFDGEKFPYRDHGKIEWLDEQALPSSSTIQ